MNDAGASPPTRRVIDVLDLMRSHDRAVTVTQMAGRLSIPRATVAAIARELHAAGWLDRDGALGYRLGSAAAGLRSRRIGWDVEDVVASVARERGCGVTLSRIDSGVMTVVCKKFPAGGVAVPGFPVGRAMPIRYPAGAAVMPWRDAAEQQRWLSTSPPGELSGPALLEFVSEHRCAVFGPTSGGGDVIELLVDLLGAGLEPSLRESTLRSIARLTSRPYTESELSAAQSIPISYISAPVVIDGAAEFELQIGLLAGSVDRATRVQHLEAIRVAADDVAAAVLRDRQG